MHNTTSFAPFLKSLFTRLRQFLPSTASISSIKPTRHLAFVLMIALNPLNVATAAGTAPLVLYTFNEGGGNIVRDVSGRGTPLDLTIANPKAVTWGFRNLRINAATLIASSTSAAKVNKALKASNAVTIEAWVKSSDVTQAGPARIVSLSRDYYLRNLTLGQDKSRYNVRLRTTGTDANGDPSVSSAAGTLNTGLTHVVYTRNPNGVVNLYLNGSRQLRTKIGGNLGNWNDAYRLALGNELNGGRPWLGTLYRVAIYDRALSVTDVDLAFAAGINQPTAPSPSPGGVTDTTPVAVNDYATSNGTAVTINPLANDSGLVDTPVRVSILSGPSHGKASVTLDNKVIYTPASGFSGNDGIIYAVTDADGDMATATISIKVGCTTCSSTEKSVTLSWAASAGQVTGYYVYYGTTATTATNFASKVPSAVVTYKSATDLNLKLGDPVCFRVKAYNYAGESALSKASCGTL